jgi:endonuclease/exonuclease/phosphatase family metal-dependent hydrolase
MVDFCKSYSPFYVCLLITLYNKPNNKFADFIADLDRLLCKLPTDALIIILSGDFNVNVKKRDKQSDSLLKLVQYHGFLPTHNNVTHRASGALDHIYINKDIINNSFISTVPLHYSDHFCYNIIHPLRAAAIDYFLN